MTADGPSAKRPPHIELEPVLRPAIAFLLIGAAVIGGCDKQSQAPQQANGTAEAPANLSSDASKSVLDRSHKGEAAPDESFLDPAGKPVRIADFKGKPLLMNLWATWCAPCVKEMPTLDTLAGRLGDTTRLIVVSQDTVNKPGDAEKVKAFFEKAQFAHLQPYHDDDAGLSLTLLTNLPATILYDSDGKEVWRMIGSIDWAGPEAAALIAEAR